MKQSRIIQVVVCLAALACGLGLARLCRGLERLFPPSELAMSGTDAAGPGRERTPHRIISLSPALTECLFALGLEDRVVGVSQYTTWPPAAAKLPRVGGWLNPNFERIIALRPDMIIFQGRFEKLREFTAKWHLASESFPMTRVPDVLDAIESMGRTAGVPARGRLVAARIRLQLAEVRAAVEGRPRPKVFLLIGREKGSLRQLYTIGGKTFVSDLIEIAGGRNIFADLTQPYPTISKEALVERKPDIIIEVLSGASLTVARRAELLAQWKALPVPAAPNRVYFLTEDFLLLPGPRIGLTARVLAKAIHPEARLPVLK